MKPAAFVFHLWGVFLCSYLQVSAVRSWQETWETEASLQTPRQRRTLIGAGGGGTAAPEPPVPFSVVQNHIITPTTRLSINVTIRRPSAASRPAPAKAVVTRLNAANPRTPTLRTAAAPRTAAAATPRAAIPNAAIAPKTAFFRSAIPGPTTRRPTTWVTSPRMPTTTSPANTSHNAASKIAPPRGGRFRMLNKPPVTTLADTDTTDTPVTEPPPTSTTIPPTSGDVQEPEVPTENGDESQEKALDEFKPVEYNDYVAPEEVMDVESQTTTTPSPETTTVALAPDGRFRTILAHDSGNKPFERVMTSIRQKKKEDKGKKKQKHH